MTTNVIWREQHQRVGQGSKQARDAGDPRGDQRLEAGHHGQEERVVVPADADFPC
jgi:hypothetical protein